MEDVDGFELDSPVVGGVAANVASGFAQLGYETKTMPARDDCPNCVSNVAGRRTLKGR